MSMSGDFRGALERIGKLSPLSIREIEIARELMSAWPSEEVEEEKEWYGKAAVEAYHEIVDGRPDSDVL